METNNYLYSKYQENAIKKEKDKLKTYTITSNEEQEKGEVQKLLINMSIKEILINISETFNSVLNDLLNNEGITLDFLIQTFTKDDRLLYISMIILFIGFCLYFIDITK